MKSTENPDRERHEQIIQEMAQIDPSLMLGLTDRQIAFCAAYARNGGNATSAYREAYDKPNLRCEEAACEAWKIRKKPKVNPIIEAVDNIRARATAEAVMGHVSNGVLTDLEVLEGISDLALHASTDRSRIAAYRLLAQIKGMLNQSITINGIVDTRPDLSRMTDDELRMMARATE